MSFGILFEVQKFLQELHFLTEKIRVFICQGNFGMTKIFIKSTSEAGQKDLILAFLIRLLS